jgi:hypothetical protein
MHRVTASAAIVLALLVCWAPTAHADTTGSVTTDDTGIRQQVGVGVSSGGHRGGKAEQCIDVPLTDVHDGIAYMPLPLGAGLEVKVDPPPGQPAGTWYVKWCGAAEFGGFFFVSSVNPIALAVEASKRLPLPLPRPELSPSGDQIVNLPSWLWLGGRWAPLSSTVSVPGVSVTAVAVPEQVVWTMGDGGQVVCDGPGVAYDAAIPAAAQSPSCAYTYTNSSAAQPDLHYQAAVTVRWHATWSAIGVAGGGDLGTIDRTSTFTVRVGEVQALNTGRR